MDRRGAEQARVFGDRVRARRRELGVSQEELGDLAGLHRTYVGHLERGEINPSLINILKVAAALDLDAADLIRGLSQTVGDPRTA